MTPRLSDEIEQAVEQNHGCARVPGQHTHYVIMSIDLYRDMMGVGSEDDLAASLDAVDKGLDDVNAGRTRPFRDVIAELDNDDAVQS